jgi:hypothetical protein
MLCTSNGLSSDGRLAQPARWMSLILMGASLAAALL